MTKSKNTINDQAECIIKNGHETWIKNNMLHREDGPAVTHKDGHKEWFINGDRHRIDGPARVWLDGRQEWWVNGIRHREDGPAVINKDGGEEWWMNGKLHREDGPACIRFSFKFWYLNGKRIPQNAVSAWMKTNRYRWSRRHPWKKDHIAEFILIFG